MKRMQSLGRRLPKDQQRQIIGGMPPVFKQATCVCWNGPPEYTCEITCAAAIAACSAPGICAKSGGLEGALITCTDC